MIGRFFLSLYVGRRTEYLFVFFDILKLLRLFAGDRIALRSIPKRVTPVSGTGRDPAAKFKAA